MSEEYCKKQKEGHDSFCNKDKGHTTRHWYMGGYWWATKAKKETNDARA